MKCKFEHDGVCCNSGAVRYKCKCKQPCDSIFPITNADRIRAMTDEELVNVVPCPLGFSMFRCPKERQCGPCKRDWLQQPAKEGADHEHK